MASGVLRPYTLADVLGTINQQQTQQAAENITGLGLFASTNETMPLADAATLTAQVMPGWDGGVWGALSWS